MDTGELEAGDNPAMGQHRIQVGVGTRKPLVAELEKPLVVPAILLLFRLFLTFYQGVTISISIYCTVN